MCRSVYSIVAFAVVLALATTVVGSGVESGKSPDKKKMEQLSKACGKGDKGSCAEMNRNIDSEVKRIHADLEKACKEGNESACKGVKDLDAEVSRAAAKVNSGKPAKAGKGTK